MANLIGIGLFGALFFVIGLGILEAQKILPANGGFWYFLSGALFFISLIVGSFSFELEDKVPFAISSSMLCAAIYAFFRAQVLNKTGVFFRKRKAPEYNWVCPSCDTVNKANTSTCKKCKSSVI